MMTKKVFGLVGCSFLAMAFACSSGDSTGSDKSGITECGNEKCQAGYHCDDPRYSQCASGCTTDNNCPHDQKCIGDICDNGGAPTNDAGPPIGCFRANMYDNVCVSHALPKSAYACNETNPPSDACVLFPDQLQYAGGYCCP